MNHNHILENPKNNCQTNQKITAEQKFLYRFAAIFLCLVLIGTVAVGYKSYQIKHTLDEKPRGLNITLYNGAFSRGFSWWTDTYVSAGSFLYLSEKPFSENAVQTAEYSDNNLKNKHFDGIKRIKATERTVEDGSRTGKIFSVKYCCHTAYVENLLSNKTYYYSVGISGKLVSGHFTTENDGETNIVNFNDFQTSDYGKLFLGNQTLSAANRAAKNDIDFFAFGGDFTSTFYNGGRFYNRYLGFVKSRDSLSESICGKPMIMASGNHDADKNLFTANNTVSYAGKTSDGGYYSFDYNNVHFVSLNTNSWDENQKNWLKKDLESAKTKSEWIIVLMHISPYTTGDHGYSMDENYIKEVSEIFVKGHADVVLQAHDHTYSKTYPYLWNKKGYTTKEKDSDVVNTDITTEIKDGIEYDVNPNGTYYISCGASGHRTGENTKYASESGEFSYRNRKYKTAISKVAVDSSYKKSSDPASADLNTTMFGMLSIKDNCLVYEFYAVDKNGKAELVDRLAITKKR